MIRYFWGDFRYFYLGITEGVFVFFVFNVTSAVVIHVPNTKQKTSAAGGERFNL